MSFGAMMGLLGIPLPGIEIGIAASAIVLGIMVLREVRPKLLFAATLVGCFAVFLGRFRVGFANARCRFSPLGNDLYGPVYDGIGHLLLTPEDLIPVIAVALYWAYVGKLQVGGRCSSFPLPG